MKNHVLGTLYGMAIGDAMGMPPELWSRKRCLEYYGKITDFPISTKQVSLPMTQARH